MEAAVYKLKKPDSHKSRKRIGRGMSSGHGKTSCRGQKGQLSRSGSKHRPWFEGGQMPLQRRVPKRGFKNKFRTEYDVVNIGQLAKLEVSEVTPEVLIKKRLARKGEMIKILGNGELSKAVKVYADAFSKSAKEKIEKAGGSVVIGAPREEKEK
ncbi:MAG TPA: 50S ribosomal protein L15 [Spirochaetes bacterium]|nr:50S ribosomal protein L15 [Spirochaetota bacterium]